MLRSRPPILLVAAALAAAGCSGGDDEGPQRAAVTGRVTLGGEPLEGGTITFIPAQGNVGPAAGTTIEDGEYYIAEDEGPLVGPNLVQIDALRGTGNMVPPLVVPETPGPAPELVEEQVNAVPARYNRQSELIREVEPGITNEFNFDLDAQ